MRQRKLIKPAILLVSISVMLCLSIGGTLAYIVATDSPVSTVFVPSIINGSLVESNESYAIVSDSNINVYARISFTINWVKDGAVYAETPITDADYYVQYDPAYWSQNGRWYYYISILEPDEITTYISVAQVGTAPEGCEMRVEATVEVIQSDPVDVVFNTWGLLPDSN